MAYSYLGQMFERAMNALKGWPTDRPLDIHGTLSSNVNIGGTGEPVVSGMCVHIASATTMTAGPNGITGPASLQFEMGASTNKMPLFLWPSANDFDVANPGVPAGVALGGTTTNKPGWVPIQPSGVLSALVAKGPDELETTEFDTDQTYAVNDFLRAVTHNTNANAGKLTNQDASGGVGFATASKCVWGDPGVANWESVVGRVSRGVYVNAHGTRVLAFWPESLPGTR